MVHILALSAEQETLWAVALGIGLVVIAVVILLLTFLMRVVQEIDAGVEEVLKEAVDVAGNTQHLGELETTLAALGQIKEEAILHDKLIRSLV